MQYHLFLNPDTGQWKTEGALPLFFLDPPPPQPGQDIIKQAQEWLSHLHMLKVEESFAYHPLYVNGPVKVSFHEISSNCKCCPCDS